MNTNMMYWWVVSSYLGLFLLLTLWITWLSPPQILPISLTLTIVMLPLLLGLRGVLHGRPYTLAWVAFLMLFYFSHGIMELYANANIRSLAGLEVLLSTTVFLGCTFFIKHKGSAND